MSAARRLSFFSKVVAAKLIEANSCVTLVRIHEIRFAADDHHECSYIEFTPFNKAGIFNVPLYHNIF